MNGIKIGHFIGAKPHYTKSNIVLIGIPLDFSSSFRSGTRLGPQEIRKYSKNLELYSPYLKKDLSKLIYYDYGDLKVDESTLILNINKIENAIWKIISSNKKIIALGGEHTISYPIVKAYYKKFRDLVVIQFDAHADLRDKYENNIYSHACVMRRITDLISFESIYQIGIRSGTIAEYKLMFRNKSLRVISQKSFESIKKEIENRPVYLTIDIDVFDPSLVSGTGTPEAGGIFFKDLVKIIQLMQKINIVGCDIVELAPEIDISGVSSSVAAKITRELILLMNKGVLV